MGAAASVSGDMSQTLTADMDVAAFQDQALRAFDAICLHDVNIAAVLLAKFSNQLARRRMGDKTPLPLPEGVSNDDIKPVLRHLSSLDATRTSPKRVLNKSKSMDSGLDTKGQKATPSPRKRRARRPSFSFKEGFKFESPDDKPWKPEDNGTTADATKVKWRRMFYALAEKTDDDTPGEALSRAWEQWLCVKGKDGEDLPVTKNRFYSMLSACTATLPGGRPTPGESAWIFGSIDHENAGVITLEDMKTFFIFTGRRSRRQSRRSQRGSHRSTGSRPGSIRSNSPTRRKSRRMSRRNSFSRSASPKRRNSLRQDGRVAGCDGLFDVKEMRSKWRDIFTKAADGREKREALATVIERAWENFLSVRGSDNKELKVDIDRFFSLLSSTTAPLGVAQEESDWVFRSMDAHGRGHITVHDAKLFLESPAERFRSWKAMLLSEKEDGQTDGEAMGCMWESRLAVRGQDGALLPVDAQRFYSLLAANTSNMAINREESDWVFSQIDDDKKGSIDLEDLKTYFCFPTRRRRRPSYIFRRPSWTKEGGNDPNPRLATPRGAWAPRDKAEADAVKRKWKTHFLTATAEGGVDLGDFQPSTMATAGPEETAVINAWFTWLSVKAEDGTRKPVTKPLFYFLMSDKTTSMKPAPDTAGSDESDWIFDQIVLGPSPKASSPDEPQLSNRSSSRHGEPEMTLGMLRAYFVSIDEIREKWCKIFTAAAEKELHEGEDKEKWALMDTGNGVDRASAALRAVWDNIICLLGENGLPLPITKARFYTTLAALTVDEGICKRESDTIFEEIDYQKSGSFGREHFVAFFNWSKRKKF
jgi:Ca2+-binding EF-hand superfamily protein